jgi:hypothetical protein
MGGCNGDINFQTTSLQMARLRRPAERATFKKYIRSVQAHTGDSPLAADPGSPVPEADGSGRSSKKFKDSIV